MKNKLLGLFLFGALALQGCGNDPEVPPYGAPYGGGAYGGAPVDPYAGGAYGNGGFGNGAYGNGAYGAGQQNYCSPEIVNSYNKFAQQCNQLQGGVREQRDITNCTSAARDFLANWGNVSCVAIINGGYPNRNYRQGNNPYNNQFYTQYQGQQAFLITSQPMQQVLGMLEQYRGGNRGWNNGYQRYPQVRCQ